MVNNVLRDFSSVRLTLGHSCVDGPLSPADCPVKAKPSYLSILGFTSRHVLPPTEAGIRICCGRNGPLMGLLAGFLGYIRSTGKSIWVPDSSSISPPTFWRFSLRNFAIKTCAELRCYEFADGVGMGQVHSFLIWGRHCHSQCQKGELGVWLLPAFVFRRETRETIRPIWGLLSLLKILEYLGLLVRIVLCQMC